MKWFSLPVVLLIVAQAAAAAGQTFAQPAQSGPWSHPAGLRSDAATSSQPQEIILDGPHMMGPGYGAGQFGGMGPGFGPGMGPGFGPGMGPGFGPGFAPGLAPGLGVGKCHGASRCRGIWDGFCAGKGKKRKPFLGQGLKCPRLFTHKCARPALKCKRFLGKPGLLAGLKCRMPKCPKKLRCKPHFFGKAFGKRQCLPGGGPEILGAPYGGLPMGNPQLQLWDDDQDELGPPPPPQSLSEPTAGRSAGNWLLPHGAGLLPVGLEF